MIVDRRPDDRLGHQAHSSNGKRLGPPRPDLGSSAPGGNEDRFSRCGHPPGCNHDQPPGDQRSIRGVGQKPTTSVVRISALARR